MSASHIHDNYTSTQRRPPPPPPSPPPPAPYVAASDQAKQRGIIRFTVPMSGIRKWFSARSRLNLLPGCRERCGSSESELFMPSSVYAKHTCQIVSKLPQCLRPTFRNNMLSGRHVSTARTALPTKCRSSPNRILRNLHSFASPASPAAEPSSKKDELFHTGEECIDRVAEAGLLTVGVGEGCTTSHS